MEPKVAVIESINEIDAYCEYIEEYNHSQSGLNEKLLKVFERIELPCTVLWLSSKLGA